MTTVVAPPGALPATTMASEVFTRDAIIAWFRGEFAAANAIIDSLCCHLAQISGEDGCASEYEAVFAAIQRRRMNWMHVVHMQRYFSIASINGELRRVATNKKAAAAEAAEARRTTDLDPAVAIDSPIEEDEEAADATEENTKTELDPAVASYPPTEEQPATETARDSPTEEEEREVNSIKTSSEERETEDYSSGGGPDCTMTEATGADDEGYQEDNTSLENVWICNNHEECMARPDRIKISKGFVAKEPVKGHMVNVVKGLKVYEDIFTSLELDKLVKFINELRLAGRKGELTGETFIFFNKQMKGNKREIVQLGVPLFQSTKEEAKINIEPIPRVLQTVIDHLVRWRLIPESRMPNSCIINFFDEDEYSQPYFKPPHLDNPISTLLLSETTMAFGRVLVSDHLGNYKGSLTIPLKEGSLLVMRGNSADMARHVVCPSLNRRVSITFAKVPLANNQTDSPLLPPLAKAMTLCQPPNPLPQKLTSGGAISYGSHCMVPSWGMTLRAPVLMLAPPKAVVMSPGKQSARNSGTGVFLPWTVGPKKYTKHLPPRIQKRRLPSLPLPLEAEA